MTTAASALAELPKGTFPLVFSAGLNNQLGIGKKRKKEADEEPIAIRYTFKPASVNQDTPGVYQGRSTGGQVTFDTSNGRQVFDVREEASKPRECVLVYDEEAQSFTLHPLPSTLHLTLNRTASSSSTARRPASQGSSTSSTSIPLARRQVGTREDEEDQSSFSSGDMRHEVSSMVGAVEDTPRPASKKRAKPTASEKERPPPPIAPPALAVPSGNGRATKSGKGLPRKKPLESAPIPVLSAPSRTTTAKGKTKAKAAAAPKATKASATRGKKATAAAAVVEPITPTKYKSAEFIEDSDEEAEEEEEEIDEFANLLGKSLAEADEVRDEEDESEDDDEDEDEDDELGGARLVVRDQGVPIMDDGSEWI
ncbi:hypothetical protein CI109_102840 [Kwoniella shandongensis]|uniref:Transcription elongation factor Eaf N-terminal domain-containing protein n=1 Tax=Kwoniella shandongensis TaxID=1734106 RepID=A0A5M6CBL8_9TREE|nr:uncharacterized protein CI109_000030 [Kwoniella shandongensis]KAA5531192.1 hypothetical protein CI109_000030 [Kwoniella shandongensis]